MRVSEFADFDTQGLLMASKQRNWIWFGLIVSLLLHLALCAYFYQTRFQSVSTTVVAIEQTPTFKVRNVDLSQLDKNSYDQANAAAKPEPDQGEDQRPDQQKSFDRISPQEQASMAIPDD